MDGTGWPAGLLLLLLPRSVGSPHHPLHMLRPSACSGYWFRAPVRLSCAPLGTHECVDWAGPKTQELGNSWLVYNWTGLHGCLKKVWVGLAERQLANINYKDTAQLLSAGPGPWEHHRKLGRKITPSGISSWNAARQKFAPGWCKHQAPRALQTE